MPSLATDATSLGLGQARTSAREHRSSRQAHAMKRRRRERVVAPACCGCDVNHGLWKGGTESVSVTTGMHSTAWLACVCPLSRRTTAQEAREMTDTQLSFPPTASSASPCTCAVWAALGSQQHVSRSWRHGRRLVRRCTLDAQERGAHPAGAVLRRAVGELLDDADIPHKVLVVIHRRLCTPRSAPELAQRCPCRGPDAPEHRPL